eukprot:g6199.t1
MAGCGGVLYRFRSLRQTTHFITPKISLSRPQWMPVIAAQGNRSPSPLTSPPSRGRMLIFPKLQQDLGRLGLSSAKRKHYLVIECVEGKQEWLLGALRAPGKKQL